MFKDKRQKLKDKSAARRTTHGKRQKQEVEGKKFSPKLIIVAGFYDKVDNGDHFFLNLKFLKTNLKKSLNENYKNLKCSYVSVFSACMVNVAE